jgi:DNA sulfur modification protein DndB
MPSNMKQELTPLQLPALRAHMGDWIYYVTFLKMRDVADRVEVAQNIHTSEVLNELIQRELQKRHSDNIRDYLLTKPQRFFNTLVIGVYGGSPKWFELDIRGNSLFNSDTLPQYIDGALGILHLDGTEDLFAIDGQHRVTGISKAIKESEELGNEEVSAIFVSHSNSAEGLERTRRLFTSLNRHAKAVSKMELIALDEDDVVAIIIRELLEKHALFSGQKISLSKGKNIPPKDKSSLTTIVALYDALDVFLKPSKKGWKEYKTTRPKEESIENFYLQAHSLWDKLIQKFKPLREMRDSDDTEPVVAKYRNENGGHLLFRPVGLSLIIKTIRNLTDLNLSLDEAIQRVSTVPMLLNQEPWSGLLWDATNRRMITTPESQRVGSKLLLHSVGSDIPAVGIDDSELKEELAGLLNRPIQEIELPKYYGSSTRKSR